MVGFFQLIFDIAVETTKKVLKLVQIRRLHNKFLIRMQFN